MKKILLTVALSMTLGVTFSQTKGITADQQAIIKELVAKLEADPNNPLKIDKQLLVDVANAIPDGPLKSKLLGYSTYLGVDENLSMRQLYWDLNAAFVNNSSLASLAPLAKTASNLNVLLNQADVLASQVNTKIANYQPGVFMSDPAFLGNLQQLTGSETAAVSLGFGLDLAMAFKHDYEQLKVFKENYASYAEMSSHMLYLEVDKRLGKALIDASVDRTPHNMITPLYRYDFDNGASIRVENGILKYINDNKKISKNLTPVENRNNGKSYQTIFSGTFGAVVSPQLLVVSPTEDKFMLQTGRVEKENECKNCLPRFDVLTINTETGENGSFKWKHLFMFDYMSNLSINDNRFDAIYWGAWPGDKHLYFASLPLDKSKATGGRIKLNPDNLFSFPNGKVKHAVAGNGASSGYRRYQSFNKDQYMISLLWQMGEGKNGTHHYSSTALQIMHKETEQVNENILSNQLTGIVKTKENKLFFTTVEGGVGSIDLNSVKDLARELPNLIGEKQLKGVLKSYSHENAYKTLFASSPFSYYSHPTLTLTPDEKHLIYTIGNNLYLMDVNKLDAPKMFTLTIDPFYVFFAKENGEPTLYVQAFNEFKFPVTKKYALNKLITAPMEDKKQTAKSTANSGARPDAGSGSVADEIKKLKVLLEEGAITQQEYEQAKKKLLN